MNDLTVVIPTHNRQAYLRRALGFYGKRGLRLVVCDSSNEPSVCDNAKYLFLPGSGYAEKLRRCLDEVKTPYVVLSADDDFIAPRALEKCVSFLRGHPDYSCVDGQTVRFSISGNRIKYSFCDPLDLEVTSETAVERLQQLSRPLFGYYAVHRTENLKEVFQFAAENLKTVQLIEILLGLITIIEGKYKKLPVFYTARESSAASVSAIPLPLHKVITEKGRSEEYTALVDFCIRKLLKKQNVSHELARAAVLHSVLAELAKYRTRAQDEQRLWWPVRRFIGRAGCLLANIYRDVFPPSYLNAQEDRENFKDIRKYLTRAI